MSIHDGSAFPRAGALLALALAGLLGGCHKNGGLSFDAAPNDYRARHPIALAEQPKSVDVFVPGGALDPVARAKIREVGAEYARSGSGPVAIQLPSTLGQDQRAHAIVDAIRHELAAGGARGSVSISTYPVTAQRLASPIRMTYHGLTASVATKCGEWPGDLASGSSAAGLQNRPYWNHGCAFQQMLATQVADPRDLAGPRAETNADVSMRTRAIRNVREGQDPATSWSTTTTSTGGGS